MSTHTCRYCGKPINLPPANRTWSYVPYRNHLCESRHSVSETQLDLRCKQGERGRR
jgi:hypothetical protein